MKAQWYFLVLFLACNFHYSLAQDLSQDTSITSVPEKLQLESKPKNDTLITIQEKEKPTEQIVEVDSFLWEYKVRKNAKRAGLYAALVPGLGQVYNKQYWKLGIVYAALGTTTGFIIYNNKEYQATRKEIADRNLYGKAVNPKYALLNDNVLLLQEDYYKQNLDLSVLLTGVGYLLQIIEAIAANHMKDFDLSPDISMKIKSSTLPNQQFGIGLAFNIK